MVSILDGAESVSVTYERQVVQSDPSTGIAITGLRSPRRGRIYSLSWASANHATAAGVLQHHAEFGTGVEFDFNYQGTPRSVAYDGPIAVEQRGGRFTIGLRLRQEG